MVAKNRKDFFVEVTNAADFISENVEDGKKILVASHMDADGISAAGILGVALKRIEAVFHIRIERWFDEKVLQFITSEKDSLIILADMGSGYIKILNEKMKGKSVIILDHHQPDHEADDAFIHVNPQFFGIDGARDISGAGISYLTMKALSKQNVDLASIAIVGALGDLQDAYKKRQFGGINSLIVEDAVEDGSLKLDTDLLFFGRETRPIHKALSYTTDPFIPGISGEEDKSLAFLIDLGIKPKKDNKWRALRDLSHEEKKKIFSSLYDYFTSQGYKRNIALNLLGTIYILTFEESWTPLHDAREFASLLNATGRTGKPGIGVAICMGDRGRCLEEANEALQKYRQMITKYLRWLDQNPDHIEEKSNIYILHGGETINEKAISAISTILSKNLPDKKKPIIAYSTITEEQSIKYSARTVNILTRKGFNIGEIMHTAAEKFSGRGGGHNIAAGAQVPFEKKEQFLEYVDALTKEYIKRLKIDGSENNSYL
jgi:RecJ-like exonuclease